MATAVIVLGNGSVESEPIAVGDDVSDAHLAAATTHLSHHLTGRSLAGTPALPRSGDAVVDRLCAAALDAVRSRSADEHVYVGGTSSMASAFDAVEIVRDVLRTLEQQFVVVSLIGDLVDRGLSVAIGGEHGIEPLSACSVVVAPILVEGEQRGSVGVLGPTRMNYPQAMATVEVVSDQLGQRLGDG
jgi:heat-inducible transcriptional repressor